MNNTNELTKKLEIILDKYTSLAPIDNSEIERKKYLENKLKDSNVIVIRGNIEQQPDYIK